MRRRQLDAGLDSTFAFYRRNTPLARPGHRHGKLEWRRFGLIFGPISRWCDIWDIWAGITQRDAWVNCMAGFMQTNTWQIMWLDIWTDKRCMQSNVWLDAIKPCLGFESQSPPTPMIQQTGWNFAKPQSILIICKATLNWMQASNCLIGNQAFALYLNLNHRLRSDWLRQRQGYDKILQHGNCQRLPRFES